MNKYELSKVLDGPALRCVGSEFEVCQQDRRYEQDDLMWARRLGTHILLAITQYFVNKTKIRGLAQQTVISRVIAFSEYLAAACEPHYKPRHPGLVEGLSEPIPGWAMQEAMKSAVGHTRIKIVPCGDWLEVTYKGEKPCRLTLTDETVLPAACARDLLRYGLSVASERACASEAVADVIAIQPTLSGWSNAFNRFEKRHGNTRSVIGTADRLPDPDGLRSLLQKLDAHHIEGPARIFLVDQARRILGVDAARRKLASTVEALAEKLNEALGEYVASLVPQGIGNLALRYLLTLAEVAGASLPAGTAPGHFFTLGVQEPWQELYDQNPLSIWEAALQYLFLNTPGKLTLAAKPDEGEIFGVFAYQGEQLTVNMPYLHGQYEADKLIVQLPWLLSLAEIGLRASVGLPVSSKFAEVVTAGPAAHWGLVYNGVCSHLSRLYT